MRKLRFTTSLVALFVALNCVSGNLFLCALLLIAVAVWLLLPFFVDDSARDQARGQGQGAQPNR